MIKKRIAAAVVVKNNRVIQSFAFTKYLPVGSVDTIIQNLDRWGVDDIMVLNIDRTSNGLGPNIEMVKKISSIPISTPLTYGGGITSVSDAIDVISSGAERIIIDSLFLKSPSDIKMLSEAIGSQAIILSIPFKVIDGHFFHFNYLTNVVTKLDLVNIKQYEQIISELLLIDVDAEGDTGSYFNEVVEFFAEVNIGLICYGGVGLSSQGSELLDAPPVNAIAYGNILNYGELFFQKVKKSLIKSKKKLRRSIYRDKI